MVQLIKSERFKPVVLALALLVPSASVLDDVVGDNANLTSSAGNPITNYLATLQTDEPG